MSNVRPPKPECMKIVAHSVVATVAPPGGGAMEASVHAVPCGKHRARCMRNAWAAALYERMSARRALSAVRAPSLRPCAPRATDATAPCVGAITTTENASEHRGGSRAGALVSAHASSCNGAPSLSAAASATLRPNHSIERTNNGRLRLPLFAAHVERYAPRENGQ
jgi:hypothetical protein